MVFFAYDKNASPRAYRFVAALTVENKISQVDLWRDETHRLLRDYLNTLIRPAGDHIYEHHEPAPGDVHDDWLWRIVAHDRSRWSKADTMRFQQRPHGQRIVPGHDELNGHPLVLADNYVVFSSKHARSFIADDPPVVARHHTSWSQTTERWLDDDVARTIAACTIDQHYRHLRTTNPQQPHRHVNLTDDSAEWLEGFLTRLDDLGIPRRRRHADQP